jgi:cation diffusion facilitator family transporter
MEYNVAIKTFIISHWKKQTVLIIWKCLRRSDLIQKELKKEKAAQTALAGGLFVFALKLIAWSISGSVALLSDALESIVNILASGIMLISVIISEKPADESHQYGHEKIENISMLIEGGLILSAGILVVYEAYRRLRNPVVLSELDLALGISLFATTLNGLLSWYLSKSAHETNSLALEADAKHLLSDVISSFGVVIGLYIANVSGFELMDSILAILISILVFKMGLELFYKAAQGLMDHSAPEEEAKILEILERHQSQFIDYHEVKTRKSGGTIYAELHLSMEGSVTVQDSHDFTEHLEEDLRKELPELIITIHVEPLEE